MPKKSRVEHCSLQYSEVGGSVACFIIEDTGMSIMIWGPRINIIITKTEIGHKLKEGHCSNLREVGGSVACFRIEYAVMSHM